MLRGVSADMKCTIRSGTTGDLPYLRDQLVMVQDLHRSAHPDKYREISPEHAESFLSERLNNQRCFVRVAVTEQNHVVGHTISEIQERPGSLFTHPQTVLYLAQIVVNPVYRRQGIGRELIEDVRALARTQEIEQVVLNVWEFEGNGRRFFLECGFQDFGYQLIQRIT